MQLSGFSGSEWGGKREVFSLPLQDNPPHFCWDHCHQVPKCPHLLSGLNPRWMGRAAHGQRSLASAWTAEPWLSLHRLAHCQPAPGHHACWASEQLPCLSLHKVSKPVKPVLTQTLCHCPAEAPGPQVAARAPMSGPVTLPGCAYTSTLSPRPPPGAAPDVADMLPATLQADPSGAPLSLTQARTSVSPVSYPTGCCRVCLSGGRETPPRT